jgi:hypothetical protein
MVNFETNDHKHIWRYWPRRGHNDGFLLRRYFNLFLITFGISWMLLDMGGTYFLGYRNMKSWLSSPYLYPDLPGILCLAVVLYFREEVKSRKRQAIC